MAPVDSPPGGFPQMFAFDDEREFQTFPPKSTFYLPVNRSSQPHYQPPAWVFNTLLGSVCVPLYDCLEKERNYSLIPLPFGIDWDQTTEGEEVNRNVLTAYRVAAHVFSLDETERQKIHDMIDALSRRIRPEKYLNFLHLTPNSQAFNTWIWTCKGLDQVMFVQYRDFFKNAEQCKKLRPNHCVLSSDGRLAYKDRIAILSRQIQGRTFWSVMLARR